MYNSHANDTRDNYGTKLLFLGIFKIKIIY